MFGWFIVCLDLAGHIWEMDRVLKMEFQEVVDYLVIRKQKADLEYYSQAKPVVEHKKTEI
jgi:hypothetical protein